MVTMLLKQMLEAPTTSPNLVVFDPFRDFDRETLIKEVIGLANAEIEGPRHILFGVNPGGMNGNIVGIPSDTVGDLKRAHRLISTLVEPVVDLAFIFDCMDGKLVGALEIDGCEFGPYFLAQDLSDELGRGACWIRRDRELTAVERGELLNGHRAAPQESEAARQVSPDNVSLVVGFKQDPDCEFIEVDVPDTSDPPFPEEGLAGDDTKKSATFTQTLRDKVGTMTTQILKMKKPARSSDSGDAADAGSEIARAANQHYLYEERAVQVELCIRNDSDIDISDLRAELGFPRIPGFDIADRIYTSPFDKRADGRSGQRGYPSVEHRKDAIFARTTIAELPARHTQQLLTTPLRLAVGPKALGKKIAMQYVLRGPDGRKLDSGRLKLRLSQDRADATGADATEVADLNMA